MKKMKIIIKTDDCGPNTEIKTELGHLNVHVGNQTMSIVWDRNTLFTFDAHQVTSVKFGSNLVQYNEFKDFESFLAKILDLNVFYYQKLNN